MEIEYKINSANLDDVLSHLNHCNNQFIPPLSSRVSLDNYAKKITENAILFEGWAEEKLVGMVAMYLNDDNHGYITNVSVYKEFGGKGIAKQIFVNLIGYSKLNNISELKLEVNSINFVAINLYKYFGFEILEEKNNQIIMLNKVI